MDSIKDQTLVFFRGAIPGSFASGLLQSGEDTSSGATSIFLGKVRADEGKKGTVVSISYTAYEQMAIDQMAEIARALKEKYPVSQLGAGHSLGDVPAGAVCLCIWATSGHRRAAIEACNEAVERLKNELPIWGRENFEGSGYRWKINNAS